LDESLKSTLPALLALLDVPVADPSWQTLDPDHRRLRTFDAIKRLLLREAREQPLLLIFGRSALDRWPDSSFARQPGRCVGVKSDCSSIIGPSTSTDGAIEPT